MSSEKSLTPQIRFKGFTEAWEQCKLGDFSKILGGFAWSSKEYTPRGEYLVITISNVTGDYFINDSIGNRINLEKESNYVLASGDILVSLTGNVGRVSKMGPSKGVLNQRVAKMIPSKKIEIEFLFQLMRDAKFELKMIESGQGAAQKNISNNNILSYSTNIPNISEQKRIGHSFKKIDSLITLHQRKLDALKKIKSALLEKMFPKDGSNIPEIRFTGFTEAWEQRKLSDVAEIIGGGTPDTNNPSYWDGDIDWYSPAELGEQIYTIGSRRRITKEGYKNSSAKLLPANKTILFTSRAGIGTTAILCRSACTNQGFQSLVISDNTDLYFIYSMSSRIKDFAISKASGSTFLEISGKQLATMSLFLPQLNEQRKIGQYFKSLDNLITLHQRKLDALKKIKSALLEKMFV